jgi:hypothetical protein
MIEAILCGGKSTKIAITQRMNPTVSIFFLYESLTGFAKNSSGFCRKAMEFSSLISKDSTRMNHEVLPKCSFLGSIFFSLSLDSIVWVLFRNQRKKFSFFADFQAKPGVDSIKNNNTVSALKYSSLISNFPCGIPA